MYSIFAIYSNNCSRGGAVIILGSNIQKHQENRISTEDFQAITLTIDSHNNLSLTAAYSPPKHQIKCDKYLELSNSHQNRFIMENMHTGVRGLWPQRVESY